MDTLYHNGTVITMERPLRAEAVLVRDGRIAAVGAAAELRAQAQGPLRSADLKGCTLLPAFVDAHSHFAAAASRFLEISLAGCRTPEEIVARLSEHLRLHPVPPGQWVRAGGYDHNQLPGGRHITAKELDQAVPDHPLIVQHASGHMGVVNTAALKLLEVPARADAIPSGVIGVEGGAPTGYLEEAAFLHYLHQLPLPGREELLAAFDRAQTLYASHGITVVQEGLFTPQLIRPYQDLLRRGGLYLHVVGYAAPEDFSAVAAALPRCVGQFHRRLCLAGYKIFLDGSPQGRTAWLRRPYEGETEYRGYPALRDEQVIDALRLAAGTGRQLLAHCNGDAACAQLLRAAAQVIREGYDLPAVRPVMVHAQLLSPDQLPQVQETGLLPSFFPAHICHWGDTHLRNLGPERAARLSPAGSALAAGVPFTFHQDTPVLPPDMLETMWCAVVRRTRDGIILGAEERISALEALRAVTVRAAWQYFQEEHRGSIAPGKWADFAVLDGDPLACFPEALRRLRVLATVAEGRTVFRTHDAPL